MPHHGLQVVEEMLWQKTGEKARADQKPEPADTNGEPEHGHATDSSTHRSILACLATPDHHPLRIGFDQKVGFASVGSQSESISNSTENVKICSET